MTEWSFEAQMQAAQAIADQWGGWMRSTGADEVVAEYEAVGPRAAVSSQVLHQGQWMNNALPMELVGLGLKALGIPMAFSPLAAAMAFGCAVATGVIFGFMPARQAARLDPVRALAGE